MKRSIVKTAKTKDEAINEALKEINKSINEVDIEVIEDVYKRQPIYIPGLSLTGSSPFKTLIFDALYSEFSIRFLSII